MPSTSAARRAPRESSSEQQPRAPSRNDAGEGDNARCTPVTSWPAETARAAATALSTPPDMAARTFIALSLQRGGGRTRTLDRRADGRHQRVDISRCRGVTEREAQGPTCALFVMAHREQHMTRPGDTGRAGRARRALDAARVQ